MTENFLDISTMLAPPVRSDSQEGGIAAQDEQEQQAEGEEAESSAQVEEESEESDEHPGGEADASEQDQDQESDEGEDDPSALKAKLLEAQKKAQDAEESRRKWQSLYDRAESDLERIASHSPGASGDGGPSEGTISQVLKHLSDNPEQFVNREELKSIISTIDEGQRNAALKQQLTGLQERIQTAVRAKPDAVEVIDYFVSEKMGTDPEAGLLNQLGNYYLAKSRKAESRIQKLEAELEEARKSARAATKKPAKMPGVSGGTTKRPVKPQKPDSLGMEHILARRQARLEQAKQLKG